MVSILEFINTGSLGPISIGVTKEYVENILGTPDDISLSNNPMILKYGSLQLAFNKDTKSSQLSLNSIHIYFDNAIKLPNLLHIEGWCPDNNTSVMEFVRRMYECNINIIQDELHTIENMQIGYRSKVGTTIIFEGEKMVSIHLTKK